ncbi:hypothetical protein [Virgibacillus pantothenticus]|uniref:hypothetical protein n=1 Tax=Virgibacillus pantothenticus TaxID=1473 RepID=UPI000984A965|nr:hypothetical protein [Virgibacillus pantothenticus]
MENKIYIEDNFFSAGRTAIRNHQNEKIGDLDLKTAFSSSINVYDSQGTRLAEGKFKSFFSSQWVVIDATAEIIGTLKANWFSFKKEYTYTVKNGHEYTITSPVFSKTFTMTDEQEREIVASFTRVSNFFSSPAYELINHTDRLSMEEFIVVVMGVNAIEKSKAAASSGGS